MKLFFKKYYREIIISLIIGFLMPSAFNKVMKTNVLESNVFANFDSIDEVIVQYHLLANVYMNFYLILFLDDEVSELASTAFTGPDDCSNLNVSTYCLAVLMNDLYTDFEFKLKSMEDEVDLIDEDGEKITGLSEGISKVLSDREKIEVELVSAEDTMDLSLALYNQIQSVYPLHKEMAYLISNLEEYRDNLSAIRYQVEQYPGRFNNASSPSCQ